MQSQLCVVLLALGLSQILAVPAPSLVLTHPDANFMQFLMQRDLANDGSHSLDCLNYYTPLLNGAVEKYNNDFKACLDEANLQIEAINDDTQENRTAIDASATDSCNALQVCSALTAADQYFECYSQAGAINAKSMFTISANATELLAYVKEQVRLIQVSEYTCTNKTQRTYAEDTADIYLNLSQCFEGAPIPAETSSTAAPETSSSLEPESSTDSSSAEPESSSTAAPESSTDSSSAEPESSSTAAPESSTDSSSAEPESSSTAAPESSTESSSAEPESSSTAAPESSTDSSSAEPESSSSAAPESSTDSSSAEPESSSSAAPESSTDSSSAEPESSSSAAPESTTDSSSAEPGSSTAAAPDAPEEDLKAIYTGTSNKNIQEILKNLQNWLKRQ